MPTPLGTPQNHPASTLNPYHHNPRRGDITAIAQSLQANGQFRPLVVNQGTHTGRPLEVLAGNHTLHAARQLTEQGVEGFDALDCYVVDVDDDQARRIVLADNRTADLGTYDNTTLASLLEDVADDLAGTGYDEDDLADLMAALEETEPLTYATGSTGQDGADPEQPSGLLKSRGLEEAAGDYQNSAVRSYVLSYSHQDYIWVSEQIAAYRQNHPGCGTSNSELFLHMLSAVNGVDLPHRLSDPADEYTDEEGVDQ